LYLRGDEVNRLELEQKSNAYPFYTATIIIKNSINVINPIKTI